MASCAAGELKIADDTLPPYASNFSVKRYELMQKLRPANKGIL